jgi:hypothetical protein
MGLLSAIDSRLVSLDEVYYLARKRTQDGRVALFHKGWGNQAALDAIDARWSLPGWAPVPRIAWNTREDTRAGCVVGGRMESEVYADQLPAESRWVRVLLVRPREAVKGERRGVVLAPTSREAGFRRRWAWAKTLLRHGLSVMMVDNPFMGERKPAGQVGGVLSHFADFPLTCAASAEECRSAVSWMLANGWDQVCVSGASQGGFSAIVAALRSDTSRVLGVGVVPPHSAESVIEEGVPGRLCAWDVLAQQSGGLEAAKRRMKPIFERTRIDHMDLSGTAPRVVVVGAKRDRYVPTASVQNIVEHLGDRCLAKWTAGGHVSAILERRVYTDAIVKSFDGPWRQKA